MRASPFIVCSSRDTSSAALAGSALSSSRTPSWIFCRRSPVISTNLTRSDRLSVSVSIGDTVDLHLRAGDRRETTTRPFGFISLDPTTQRMGGISASEGPDGDHLPQSPGWGRQRACGTATRTQPVGATALYANG